MHRHLQAAALACAVAQAACAPIPVAPGPDPVPAASANEDPRTTRELARAQRSLDESRRTLGDVGDLEPLMADARRAAAAGQQRRARQLAEEVAGRSDLALDARLATLAQLELQKAQTYTGLSDAQLGELRSAELALARGAGRKAHAALTSLNRSLAQSSQKYVVAAGDSLWIISARSEIYGNPQLWPLIWRANLDAVPDPDRLRRGLKLKIRTNPTIDEVVQAVNESRRGSRMSIGEIRSAP